MNTAKKQLECELRGPITWADFVDIKSKLIDTFGAMTVTKELALFIRGRYDIRIKINTKGCVLVNKIKIGVLDYKKEFEMFIPHSEALPLIKFIYSIGFTKFVSSYVEKYEFTKDNKSFSVKFGSKIGDFFEIETLLDHQQDITNATMQMEVFAKHLGLKLWQDSVYQDLVKLSWKNESEQDLCDASSFDINPNLLKHIDHILGGDHNSDKTLREILMETSNDFTSCESLFRNLYKSDLLSTFAIKNRNFHTKVSIIIPSYNSQDTLCLTLQSICRQDLTQNEFDLVEVIIVDDGSNDETMKKVGELNLRLNFKYIKQNNLGRSAARNVGVAMATGEVIIFVDADIIMESNFIKEHVLRHEVIDKAVFVSFKQNIQLTERVLSNICNTKPNIENDFRFCKYVHEDWLRMHRHVRAIESREVRLMSETRYFKDFGCATTLGVWDLPAMVVTNAISIKRTEFLSCGGFNLQFRGWGMEDTFLGACLIARKNFVIPVLSTGVFHIEHENRSGSEDSKIKEFNRNVLIYLDLINQKASKVLKNICD